MTTDRLPPAPPGTGTAGRRLWRGVLADFDLTGAESEILRECVRVTDMIDRLEQEAAAGPLTITDKRGEAKTAPAIVETRQQRALLARLVASLRLPDLDTGERPQRRGAARGAYARGRATGRAYGATSARLAAVRAA